MLVLAAFIDTALRICVIVMLIMISLQINRDDQYCHHSDYCRIDSYTSMFQKEHFQMEQLLPQSTPHKLEHQKEFNPFFYQKMQQDYSNINQVVFFQLQLLLLNYLALKTFHLFLMKPQALSNLFNLTHQSILMDLHQQV